MENDLDPLLQQIRACRLCASELPTGVKPLLAASSSSRIVLVGQAPGRIADQTGIPWNDKSGIRLRKWLGVSDAEFYNPALFAIVPMGFCYPGRGASGDLPPRPECAPLWHPKIFARLNRLGLTICVGRYAFESVFKGFGRSFRETVQEGKALLPHRIALPHPSPRNQGWLKQNPWFEREILPALQKRVRAILDSTSIESSRLRTETLA